MQPVLPHSLRTEEPVFWRGNQATALLVLLLSWSLAQSLSASYGQALPLWSGLWLQAGAAALLSLCLAQPWWWVLINAGFLPTVDFAMAQHWPPTLFLLALLLSGLTFGATFLTRVPFYPSKPAVWKLVEAMVPPGEKWSVLDMGSGIGGFCLHLAQRRPKCRVQGIEWALLPWLLSRLRAWRRGSACCLIHGDYRQHSLAQHDLVFVYLSPAFMPTLWDKACREMKPGAWLVSCEFPVPGQPAEPLPGSGVPGVPALYGWRMGEPAHANPLSFGQ